MLTTILARLNNDEQRWQCLQTLRSKLSHYNLSWSDLRSISELFANVEHRRLDLIESLLPFSNHSRGPIEIDDYLRLLSTENEARHFRLFEQISPDLKIRSKDDVQRLIESFSTRTTRQKVETILRTAHEHVGDQHIAASFHLLEPVRITQVLPPTSSSTEDELTFEHHAEILPILSANSSDCSLSSGSDENIPIRTRSFMVAIKNTFERLRETSSWSLCGEQVTLRHFVCWWSKDLSAARSRHSRLIDSFFFFFSSSYRQKMNWCVSRLCLSREHSSWVALNGFSTLTNWRRKVTFVKCLFVWSQTHTQKANERRFPPVRRQITFTNALYQLFSCRDVYQSSSMPKRSDDIDRDIISPSWARSHRDGWMARFYTHKRADVNR